MTKMCVIALQLRIANSNIHTKYNFTIVGRMYNSIVYAKKNDFFYSSIFFFLLSQGILLKFFFLLRQLIIFTVSIVFCFIISKI